MGIKQLIGSTNSALDGIVYAFRTQRNMRIHFLMASLVMLLAVLMRVSRVECAILMLTIGFVMAMELLNTAVEVVVDLVTQKYNLLARIAKNVAAGAVMLAALVALSVGFLIFYERLSQIDRIAYVVLNNIPVYFTAMSLGLVFIVVVAVKARVSKGTYLRGGFPSGHTALAFSLALSIALISKNLLLATLATLIASLVAQSRLESKTHTLFEVVCGALVGILVTFLVFQLSILAGA